MSVQDINQKWLIGAGAFCDLVIDEPAVSSRHCQLTSADGLLLLNDLDSTNGTWVNGTRIKTAVPIGPDDVVRLGTQTTVSWDQITHLVDCQIVRIGREPDNDVVLIDERVSGYHARLLIDGDQLTLIDLESSNGTSVGGPDPKISRTQVSLDDDVYFGSIVRRVQDLVVEAASHGSASLQPKSNSRVIVVATAAALLLVAAAFLLIRPWERQIQFASTASPEQAGLESTETQLSPEQHLERSLFAVVVRSESTEPGLRVGTAWVVSERRLATSGNLVLFLQQSKTDFPIVTVQRLFDGGEYPVTGTIVHPVCAQKTDRMQGLGIQIEESRRRLESTSEITSESDTDSNENAVDAEAIRTLAEDIIELEDQWFVAAEEMIHFDAGLLVTELPLTTGTGIAQLRFAADTPSRLAPVAVAGAAFPHEQSILVESTPLPLAKLKCTLESLAANSRDGVSRLVLRCPPGHDKQNWLGAPTLNSSTLR